MQKEIFNQLHQDEPPPRDIFTVFRENHPETIFELQRIAHPSPADFTRKTEVNLRSGETVTEPNSIVKLIQDRAVISDANRAVYDTIDVNACLKDHNWEGAEHILGRPLTNEEKQAQIVKEQQAPLIDQAARQLKIEELKGKIKSEKKKRRALLAKWKAARDKKDKAERDAIAAEIARVNKILADDLEDLLRMARQNEDDDDDDDDLDLGGHAGGDDSDQDDDDDDDLPGLDDSISTVVYRGKKKGNEEKEDADSIASTVLDRRRGKAKVDTIKVDPLDPNLEYSKPDLVQRGRQLRTMFPELGVRGTGMLSSLTGDKATIRARIEAAEKWIDKKRDEERDRKLQDDIEDVLASPTSAAQVPLPLGQDGLGAGKVFTGLLKKKNEQDYVKWNDRFVINLKKLKDKGTFALFYPRSGQPHNQIKTAQLTPALKEIVLAYMRNEPQDTTNLTPEELKWLKNVWQMSGVTKPPPRLRIAPKLYKGKADMRARLKELMGLSLAGNDNPELMAEMSKIVDRLEDKGWMTKEEIINSRRFIEGQ